MYAMLAALASWHLVLLVRFLLGVDRRLGPLFALLAVAMAGTHYYALPFLGGELAALALLRPVPVRSWLPAAAVAGAAAVIAVIPAAFVSRHNAGWGYDLGVLALPGAVWSLLSGYALMPSSAELHARGWRAAAPFAPFAVAAAAPLAFCLVEGARRLAPRARLAILLPFGAMLVGPWVVQTVLPVGMNPRYLIAATPLLLVIAAAALAAPALHAVRVAAVATLAVVMASGTALHLAEPGHGREDVAAAAAWLDRNVPVGETIVVTSNEMAELARFHWPERRIEIYPPEKTVTGAGNAARLADEFPFPAGGRAIYVVGREWISDPDELLGRELAERYDSCRGASMRGIRILCFEQRARQTAVGEDAKVGWGG